MNPSLTQLFSACNLADEGRGSAFDVGAHHGEYAKFLIDTGMFADVVSFEPNPDNSVLLTTSNLATAGCRHRVVNVALGSESGAHEFYCNGDTATGSLLDYAVRPLREDVPRKQTVQVVTLDEFVAANPVTGRLQLLKIDTQGTDVAVIAGGARTIAEHRPIIQAELIHIPLYRGQCSPMALEEAIAGLGYRMYSLNNLHVTPEGRLAFCDALFVPNEMDIAITQQFTCIDDQISFRMQLETLSGICAERLAVINVLDTEVKRLRSVLAGAEAAAAVEEGR